MPRAIPIFLLLSATLLATPMSASPSADLDHAAMRRATVLSQLSAYIRTHAPARASELRELPEIIMSAGDAYGIDPFILMRLIRTESTFDRRAVSSAGAIGLPQFLPSTIRMHRVSLPAYQRSIRIQVNLAARYLRDLTVRYGGRQDLALLAYNGNLTPSQSRYVMRVQGVR